VDPENLGVRLRRRNPHLRWYDCDFDIHPELTRGKTQLDIQLRLARDIDTDAFTDFSYTVFCFNYTSSGSAISKNEMQ